MYLKKSLLKTDMKDIKRQRRSNDVWWKIDLRCCCCSSALFPQKCTGFGGGVALDRLGCERAVVGVQVLDVCLQRIVGTVPEYR